MIHFTPVEELSRESNSSYSLRDHRKLNENASDNGRYNFKDLESLLNKIYQEWGILTISDLVYNHMSNDAPFLKECPDAGYNLQNSKFLRPGFLFDRLLHYLNKDIENGKHESIGIKNEFTLNDLMKIIEILKHDLVPKVKFEEFYSINIEKTLKDIREEIIKCPEISGLDSNLIDLWSKLKIVQDPNYSRLKCTVDFNIVKEIISLELTVSNSENIIMEKFENFK
jgi:glycogen debranching enzyme